MKPGKDYIGAGASAIICNENGEILLTKRGREARNQPGKWEAPGGCIEFGEKSRETVIREAREELDIDIEILETLGFIEEILIAEGQHWIGPTFLARIVGGEPRLREPNKCECFRWFSVDEAERLQKTGTLQQDLLNYRKYKSAKSMDAPKTSKMTSSPT